MERRLLAVMQGATVATHFECEANKDYVSASYDRNWNSGKI